MVTYSLLLWVGIAGISGLLPAIITYKYSPIDIVKGNFRMHNKQLFSRLFIIVQNVISTVLITLGLTMAFQIYHLATLPTGYNTDLVFVKTWELGHTYDKQVILQKRLQALPQVTESSVRHENCLSSPVTMVYNNRKKRDTRGSTFRIWTAPHSGCWVSKW